jgi:hypothetical protein
LALQCRLGLGVDGEPLDDAIPTRTSNHSLPWLAAIALSRNQPCFVPALVCLRPHSRA